MVSRNRWHLLYLLGALPAGCVQMCGIESGKLGDSPTSSAGTGGIAGIGGTGGSGGSSVSMSTGQGECMGQPDETSCSENGGKVCHAGTCVDCTVDDHCRSGLEPSCIDYACVPEHCSNGSKDGDESDEDCGGATCPPCKDGDTCNTDEDCISKGCHPDKKCDACANGTKGEAETDVDCGGGACPACTNGNVCDADADCASTFCADGFCCDSKCDGTCRACAGDLTGGDDGQCAEVVDGMPDPIAETPCSGIEFSCDGAGMCKAQLGVECSTGVDCLSGFCADGVCCETVCIGTCRACSAAKKGAGSDGTCGALAAGTDPDGECADQGAPSCGTSGLCDGAGACQKYTCPSCTGGLDCGGLPCCLALPVTGGTFPMGRGSGNDAFAGGSSNEQPEHTVVVDDFYLDAFEVTVGRFRKFVDAFDGAPPSAGAGAHPLIAGSGWQEVWNSSVAGTQAALISNLKCNGVYQTWMDAAGANENLPINCVSWFEAFAFCAWDGSRLPTEAEWEYAAAGGSDNRLYPWANGATPNNALAVFGCGGDSCTFSDIVAVGSAPAGNGKWDHRDLAGSMWEWNLDWHDAGWYSGGGFSCSNCANTSAGLERVGHGGSWGSSMSYLRAAVRLYYAPEYRSHGIGIRCAKTP